MAAEDFFASLNPLAAFGLNTATTQGPSAAGAGLPVTSSSSSFDHGEKPWHPDSPIFWVAMIAIASAVGIVGASVSVSAGPASAGAKLGK
ncbi:hypothetical protein ACWGLK_31680 [Streptomyces albidoflavus]|uniref:hypothetical protein n=1 Tax=unclassified Streptomyces TaxID=2593676 RepID=UPI0035DD3576